MERIIKVELLESDKLSFIKDRDFPDGITVKGPIVSQMCSPGAPHIPAYLLITISYVGTFFAGVAKDLAKEKAKQWIADYLARHKTKRARINGREANSDTMAIEIEVEIDKND